MTEMTYYALLLTDDDTLEDPSGVIRVSHEADELRAAYFDYDEDTWVEDNTWLERVFFPDGDLEAIPAPLAQSLTVSNVEKHMQGKHNQKTHGSGSGSLRETDEYDGIEMTASAAAAIESIFGHPVSGQQLAELAGLPSTADDLSTRVTIDELMDGTVEIVGESFDYMSENTFNEDTGQWKAVVAMNRTVYKEDDGTITIRNDNFFIEDGHLQGQGIGTRAIARQVQTARALGVSRIETYGIGSGKDAKREDGSDRGPSAANGYYTWPRLGFDGPLPPHHIASARNAGVLSRSNMMPNVSDLMKTKTGRDYWKDNGSSISVSLEVDGPTGKRFERYAKAKGVW